MMVPLSHATAIIFKQSFLINYLRYKYYFYIGSIDSFERKIDEAERELGISAEQHVPIQYVQEFNLGQEVIRFAPTLLLVAVWIYLSRRPMGGSGMMGGGGVAGGRSLFNVGKAQVGAWQGFGVKRLRLRNPKRCHWCEYAATSKRKASIAGCNRICGPIKRRCSA